MKLSRDVTKAECPWLDEDLPAGLEVHQFNGCTYGCVGAGVAVTREPGQNPFFEVPRDALVGSPRNAMGLTPDAVKASPEFRAAKIAFERSFAKLRAFNDVYIKKFANEARQERLTRRAG